MTKLQVQCISRSVLTGILQKGAANRFPDKCDADPDAARALNVDATKTLACATSSRNILLIYISTDYVFSGKPGEAPYEADSPTHPANHYGQTKRDGEMAVLEETRKTRLGVILRVPVLYGHAEESQESAVNALLDAVWKVQEKGVTVQMDDWAQRYPTNTEDVGRVCQDIATYYLQVGDLRSRAELPSVLQFSSPDRFTKYEICQLFAEILGLPLDGILANKTGNDPKAITQRPYDTHLSSKLLEDLGIQTWTQDFKAWW